jgi:hypothetical protein
LFLFESGRFAIVSIAIIFAYHAVFMHVNVLTESVEDGYSYTPDLGSIRARGGVFEV